MSGVGKSRKRARVSGFGLVIFLLNRKPGPGWISLDLGLEIAAFSLCIRRFGLRKISVGAGHLDEQIECVIKYLLSAQYL